MLHGAGPSKASLTHHRSMSRAYNHVEYVLHILINKDSIKATIYVAYQNPSVKWESLHDHGPESMIWSTCSRTSQCLSMELHNLVGLVPLLQYFPHQHASPWMHSLAMEMAHV